LYLQLTQPDYLAPLFSTTLGLLMCGAAAVMMTIGVFWLKTAVKVEV
jgi:tight adherence protein B